jgi:SAM-dependent MidA family methyltransferase
LNDVAERIKAEIDAHGVIPFARFMDLALYCPECGYYEKENDIVGRRGDFYTSVSVGPLFGELLAFQFATWLHELQTERIQIIEGGAHDGRLAADILRWLRQWRPEIFGRLEYWISEVSARRREWQRRTLTEFADRVRWVGKDPSQAAVPCTGIIFANELLDAMPVHRFGWSRQHREWFEWGVVMTGGRFTWARMLQPQLGPESPAFDRLKATPAELLDVLPDDFTVESSPAAEGWWFEMGRALQQGRLVTLDYGFTTDEFLSPHRPGGTLRAYHKHRVCDDLLANPGAQDLTAHLNFPAIQEAGERAGLTTEIFTSQADFLAGIMKPLWSEMEARVAGTTTRSREFQTLIHPEHLGRAFRVLVQSRRA